MKRVFASLAIFACLVALPALAAPAHGSAAEAKAMLEKAAAAYKADPKAAITNFNKADGGFRDRDLYVACFDARSGIVQSHVDPKQIGVDIRTVKQPDGTAFGQKLFDAAKAGTISTVDYEYFAPGGSTPLPKQSYVTRVGNEGCLVGYYK